MRGDHSDTLISRDGEPLGVNSMIQGLMAHRIPISEQEAVKWLALRHFSFGCLHTTYLFIACMSLLYQFEHTSWFFSPTMELCLKILPVVSRFLKRRMGKLEEFGS